MTTDAHLHVGSGGINATLKSVRGQIGPGNYRTKLELDLVPPRPAEFASAHLLASARVGVSAQGKPALPLGTAHFETPVAFPSATSGGQVRSSARLYFDIGPGQLDAVEVERGRGGLMLQLDLQGHFAFEDRFEPFWGTLSFLVSPKDWLTVLEDVRYAQGVLIQIPQHASQVSPSAALAAAQIDLAGEAINQGRYREAVSLCRDALEQAYPGIPAGYRDHQPTFPSAREADKDIRFWWLQRALLTVTHAAKHADEVTAQIEWERSDAVAAVSILAALVSRQTPT